MEKTIINFGDNEIKKQKFHQHKGTISIKKNINKIVVSNKVSLSKKGFKYFVGYKSVKKNWEKLVKGTCKKHENFSEEEKDQSKKRSKKDIKFFLKNRSRNYLRIWKTIMYRIKK